MPRIALALLLLMVIGGCARPRYGLETCLPENAWTRPHQQTVQSLRYRVRSDAGKPAALEVSRFMERSAALWTPLFGVPAPTALPLEIRLHRDRTDLARVLASQQLTAKATGLYLPTPTPAIHVACSGEEPGHPYRTLLHEGTHQFIHLGAGFRAAGQPPAIPRLALPLWLSEGLASYYEAAYITPDLLQPGRPDPTRLAELQDALRQGKTTPLGEILAKRYGDPFATLDYAVAWGMVYTLMQEAPPPWAVGGRDWLKALVAESRRGWPTATSPPHPAPVAVNQDWWATVTDQTRRAFESFANERGLTVAAWEKQWREWILAHP